jgi:hypothetical protein
MPEETKSEEDEDGDILGEFAKHYEAGVYLEVKAEGYRRQSTQPTIEEDEDEERSEAEEEDPAEDIEEVKGAE